ncbi:hypothetical protein [Streptosporangium roseum]|uniref:hypothetical protein n=1 Tax=Streptosporangium roseum TaxID=2001 RepID=UPI00332D7857
MSGLLRERIGMQRLREITADAWNPLPKDHGRLSELESSYTYLRQFTPTRQQLSVSQVRFACNSHSAKEYGKKIRKINLSARRRAGTEAGTVPDPP